MPKGLYPLFLLTISFLLFGSTIAALAQQANTQPLIHSPANVQSQNQTLLTSSKNTDAPPENSGQNKDFVQEFVLNNFYLSSTDTTLTARLSLSITDMAQLANMLRDGARLKLKCDAHLYRKRTFWANSLLDSSTFVSSLRYAPLQREFIIMSANIPPLSQSVLTSLLQVTWGNLEMPLCRLEELEKGETYLAEVVVGLYHEEMPPWLKTNVFFWSDEIIAPKTYQLEFTY